MADFVIAAKASEIGPGTMKTVRVAGKAIAIANVDGKFFAIDDTCTHAQCSLGSEGFLDGDVVVCGCHGARYDASSGEVLSLPAPAGVASYIVKVEGDTISIAI